MILFFGTRPGKSHKKKLPLIPCPHCRQVGSLTLTTRTNLAHLFWVPLFNLGSSLQVECSHCKRVYTRNEFSPEMERAVE